MKHNTLNYVIYFKCIEFDVFKITVDNHSYRKGDKDDRNKTFEK